MNMGIPPVFGAHGFVYVQWTERETVMNWNKARQIVETVESKVKECKDKNEAVIVRKIIMISDTTKKVINKAKKKCNAVVITPIIKVGKRVETKGVYKSSKKMTIPCIGVSLAVGICGSIAGISMLSTLLISSAINIGIVGYEYYNSREIKAI